MDGKVESEEEMWELDFQCCRYLGTGSYLQRRLGSVQEASIDLARFTRAQEAVACDFVVGRGDHWKIKLKVLGCLRFETFHPVPNFSGSVCSPTLGSDPALAALSPSFLCFCPYNTSSFPFLPSP